MLQSHSLTLPRASSRGFRRDCVPDNGLPHPGVPPRLTRCEDLPRGLRFLESHSFPEYRLLSTGPRTTILRINPALAHSGLRLVAPSPLCQLSIARCPTGRHPCILSSLLPLIASASLRRLPGLRPSQWRLVRSHVLRLHLSRFQLSESPYPPPRPSSLCHLSCATFAGSASEEAQPATVTGALVRALTSLSLGLLSFSRALLGARSVLSPVESLPARRPSLAVHRSQAVGHHPSFASYPW
jgi:hypothetical protein